MFLPIYEMNWVRDECRYAGLSPASFELEAERHAHLNIAALTLTLEFVDDSSARTAEDRVACALDDHVLDFAGCSQREQDRRFTLFEALADGVLRECRVAHRRLEIRAHDRGGQNGGCRSRRRRRCHRRC